MNTCPKCGSPQASELTLSGFSLRKAMWFGCGSHVLLDEPEKIISRTNQCCDQERINQLEEALRSIVNGDILHSREKAKMALEGTFSPVDEKPEQEAKSHSTVKDPFYFKGYWYQEYMEMREKYHKQMGENSEQAERIRELEEHSTKQNFLIDELADSLRSMVAHCEGFVSNLKEGR